jgi:hypothetical protein
MAESIDRNRGRPAEYKSDRGGTPVEMGPFIGIVVNNVDNTRQGRLQVWIEQFGNRDSDGSPNLIDTTTWRTVRYCPPFYGATKQSGATGVGSYPGNRNSYGMWFTPPDLGTKVLCFFVLGDPTAGGYYIGCIPEDGLNHMIPAIGATSNFAANNTVQQGVFKDVPSAPVTEINDIDPEITNSPRFFDKPKPIQSSVAAVLFQQGLTKDPIRGPIKSSAQRESPSNCYGISTPGKAIYQGGYSDKTLKQALQAGQVKLQDIAVVGRQGGHTFVMDDGDIDGKDTLIRIRTAKGHQITMSDDGDSFYITHANGQTWMEFGKSGTVDVYSTNSINLRSEGVLNFHADKGINMYSGGTVRIKSKGALLMQSDDNLLLNSQKSTLISSKQLLGLRSDGTLGLQGKFASIKSGSQLNLKASLINLNGASAASVPEAPTVTNVKLPDTEYLSGRGWTSLPDQLETIVSRAPTHEPFLGHGQGANVSINLNPIPVVIPDAAGAANNIYETVSAQPVQRAVTVEQVISETISPVTAGTLTVDQITVMTAQSAANVSALYPAYDANGVLRPGFELDENNNPVYVGPDLGSASRGVGVYAQSPSALVSTGMVNPAALTLIQTGVSPQTVLESTANWTGQFGINSLSDYLSNRTLQNVVQIGLVIAAYQGLKDRGILKGDESPRYTATFVQPATTYGVDSVTQWVDGFASSNQVDALTVVARQGQYAIDFVEAYGAEINLLDTVPTGTFEADREDIDQVVANIIGNPKVPVPQYTETPAVVEVTVDGVPVLQAAPVIQPDDTIVRVPVTVANTQENGLFRLAPGYKRG